MRRATKSKVSSNGLKNSVMIAACYIVSLPYRCRPVPWCLHHIGNYCTRTFRHSTLTKGSEQGKAIMVVYVRVSFTPFKYAPSHKGFFALVKSVAAVIYACSSCGVGFLIANSVESGSCIF